VELSPTDVTRAADRICTTTRSVLEGDALGSAATASSEVIRGSIR
jgi:hypothetical protein